MRYISIDIETTGLNPKTCDVIEIGALIEDTDDIRSFNQMPSFHCYVWKDNYRGEPYALAMNAHIFQKMLELRKAGSPLVMYPEDIAQKFGQFLRQHFGDVKPTVAGKNVAGFDLPFLTENILNWGYAIKFHHRVIDPGMMYFDPRNDQVPPDLKECKKRAKLPEQVSHEALDDAWDVIQLVRAKFPLI